MGFSKGDARRKFVPDALALFNGMDRTAIDPNTMCHQFPPLIMALLISNAVPAQLPDDVRHEPNWLAAYKECLGDQASPGWMMDMEADGMEVYTTDDKALVLVDRSPIRMSGNKGAYLRDCIRSTGGTELRLMGEVDHVNDSVLHGIYDGTLNGTAVRMDEFVSMRDGVLLARVMVIRRIVGSAPFVRGKHEEIALALLLGAGDPGPKEQITRK